MKNNETANNYRAAAVRMAASAQLRVYNGTFTWERRYILEQVVFNAYDTDAYTINDVEVTTTNGARLYKSYYSLGLKTKSGSKTSITVNPSKTNCSLYVGWSMLVTYNYQGKTYTARYTKRAGDIEPCEIFDNHYWDCTIISAIPISSTRAETREAQGYTVDGVRSNGRNGIVVVDGRKVNLRTK